jgi:hypothetical protein
MYLPFGTPESHRLCEEVSSLSGGTCIFGFSRGKDSLAAWLYLRRFFKKIVPFHCCGVPHLSFVDQSLDYYDGWFGTRVDPPDGWQDQKDPSEDNYCWCLPIERCMSGYVQEALHRLIYQPYESRDAIIRQQYATDKETGQPYPDLNIWVYNNNEVADLLRGKHGAGGVKAPLAYAAYGIAMWDSLFRRVRLQRDGVKAARHEGQHSFYPCFDWKGKQIVNAIKEAGVLLPRDYLTGNRSYGGGVPGVGRVQRMKQLAPKDFEKVRIAFPLIEAGIARNEFRKRKWGRSSDCDDPRYCSLVRSGQQVDDGEET